MHEWHWLIRRSAVLLAGQGPRRTASLATQLIRGAVLLVEEPGQTFAAPVCRLVTGDAPADTAHWPTEIAVEPARRVYLLNEAGLYDDDGVIYDLRSRRAFVETLDYWRLPAHRHPALGLPRVNPPLRLDGLSVFLGGLGGQTFYHFIVEILPQLGLLAAVLPKAARLIVQGYIEPNKEAWLRHVGVKLPIHWLRPLDHLQCEQLAFSLRVVRHYQPNPWALAVLRHLAGVETGGAIPRRRFVWVDRRNAAVRAVSWEREVIAKLPPPWEPVDFGTLNPAATIALCAEIGGFAGFHGAGFANLALCPPGVRVVEFYPEPKESWYPGLSAVAGHQHTVMTVAGGAVSVLDRLDSLTRGN